MNKYIVKIISPVDSSLKQEIEINAYSLLSRENYYEFTDKYGFTVACFPIDKVIILRIKD